jgi:acetyltransferase-like isoleucine patch superfamily enzyme
LLNRIRIFARENGFYVLAASSCGALAAMVRNYLISKKLKVRRIRIGSRAYLRGLSAIKMGEDFAAAPGLWLEAIIHYNEQTLSPKIIIGDHVRLSQSVHIAATHCIEIGDNVLMGSKVTVTDHNHGQYSLGEQSSPHTAPALRQLDSDRRVLIARNVWLGDGVVVTAGASIGEGCIIGANSVVQGAIPAFTIATGAPARPRKTFNFAIGKWCNVE